MGVKRVIDTDFWTDDKVVDMFSPEDKLFFLYLLTNPHTTQLGIYALNKKVMAFEIGYSVEAVTVLIERFEGKYNLIRYSKDTSEIAIKNYLRHSIIKGGKPVEDLLQKEISKVKDTGLLKYVCGNLASSNDINETVQKVLSYIKLNENDNDNENEVSYHDSYHDSSKRTKKVIPPTLEEVQNYIDSKGYIIEARAWYDYYESNNWKTKDGKNILKNWKQYVVTWNNREKKMNPVSNRRPDFLINRSEPTISQEERKRKQEEASEWYKQMEKMMEEEDGQ